jgi:hypothetical protein
MPLVRALKAKGAALKATEQPVRTGLTVLPLEQPGGRRVYRALTTPAHNQIMMKRDDMSAVIEGLQKEQGLLAAFLEATHKIDWRTLHKPAPIRETPKPLNVETTFVLQRANLVRASDRSLVLEGLQRDEG